MRLRSSTLAVLAAAAALTVVAGCAGSSTSTSTSKPATAEGLADTARAAATSLISGDMATGYDYVDQACKDQKTRSEFVVEGNVALEMAKAFGLDLTKAKITDVQTRNVSADAGQVRVVAEIDGEPMSEDESWDDWVYEDGAWRTTNCGDDDSDPSSADTSTTETTVGGSLRPSGEAQAEKELNAATAASIGQSVDLGEGVSVTVTSVALGKAYGDPAIAVGLRVENRGDDTNNPNVEVRCAGSTEGGMATSDGGSYETMAKLPSGSFAEGVVNVLPESGTCATPAFVFVTPFFSMDDTAVKVPIDDTLIAQLNAG